MTYLTDECVHVNCNEYQNILSIGSKILKCGICESCSFFDMMDMCGELFLSKVHIIICRCFAFVRSIMYTDTLHALI